MSPRTISLAFIAIIICSPLIRAAQTTGDSTSTIAQPASSSLLAQQQVALLDFKNTEIKDIVRGLATKYNFNVFIDDAITQRVTLRLVNVSVLEALRFIVAENGLLMSLEGNICKISQPEIPKPEPKPLAISCDNGKLSVDVQDEDIDKVVRVLAEKSRANLVLQQGVTGKVTGFLQDIPLDQGLQALMTSNGYSVRKLNGIYRIDRDSAERGTSNSASRNAVWTNPEDSLLTIDVAGGALDRVVRDLANEARVDLFIYGDLAGKVDAQCSRVPFERALDYLFKGTNYTYRHEGGVYFIGDKSLAGIASAKLVRARHIKSEGLIDLLPNSIKANATLNVVKEQNGIMVVGAADVIREVENFVAQIDRPIAQILIEALVVDYNTADIGELGLNAGMRAPGDTTAQGANSIFPFVDYTASANVLNDALGYYGDQFGLKKIGKLPDRFYVNLRALEKKGKVNIRSQPQIATLNGHPASIKIGTTQYYILETQQPIVGGNQIVNQISQRFEKITAEISLTITPWVSASGEITTEIQPEFSTPQGSLDPNLPPTINHRTLNSTVRLRDGETIILGGLIQTSDNENIDKFPLLGSIPMLGRLFQNRGHNRTKSELMIYLTPHLYYTEGNEGGVIR